MLFAIEGCFATASAQIDKIVTPSATEGVLGDPDATITMAAQCFNSALDAAVGEYLQKGKIFSPQNWLKSLDSVQKIQAAVSLYLSMMKNVPGGPP